MEQNPPSPPLPAPPGTPQDDLTASSLFDWSDFLDFNLDESLSISFPQSEPEQQPGAGNQKQSQEKPSRVRKRDPRLVCSNFLSGRIPCACPELDEKLEEEEEEQEEEGDPGLPGKKRTRTVRISGGAPTRCQVPDCEVDITELKGYHRRHRVCLRCANASSVVINGERKRYCQQCGKFHVLSDFDEGKRSCRRKLERHNRRRRRKPGPKGGADKESQQIVLADDLSGDDDNGKDGAFVSSQIEERETLLDSDGQFSALCSTLGSHSVQTDSVVSFDAFGETHIDGDTHSTKSKCSPSYCDNKSNLSSVCPTGRISFKLYDWNPAEFPRRLRHQIFQWLASMPVELEGYIRPGCTILTAFIAMPKPMWHKLLEEPALCIKDLIASPKSVLSGRGMMFVYLNDMIFQVTKDANSVVKIKVKDQVPKLHYIYPTFFEAGKPMEFVACGSYLLQPNFRFLISFAGRYLVYNIQVSSMGHEKGDANWADHQLLKIYVPQINMDLMGPAFVEVENQSGLSNFIPILIGDKDTCAEMEILQQKFDKPFSSQERTPSPPWLPCEVFALRQAQLSEFVLDVAWLLQKPTSEQQLTSIHVQRFNHLLNFLIEKESCVVLERLLCSLEYYMDNNLVAGISDSEMKLLWKNMDVARSRDAQKLLDENISLMSVEDGNSDGQNFQNDTVCVVPATNWGMQRTAENIPVLNMPSPFLDEGATVPLLKGEVIVNVNLLNRPGNSCSPQLTRTFFTSRLIIFAIAAIGVCFGICAVALHPQRAGKIATSIQRCLFNNS